MARKYFIFLLILLVLPIVNGQGVSVTDEALQDLIGLEGSMSFKLTIFNEQDVGMDFEVLTSVVDWELSSEKESIFIGARSGKDLVVTLSTIEEKEAKIHNVPITVASLDRSVKVNHVLKVKVAEQPVLPRLELPGDIEPGSNVVFNVDVENREEEPIDGLRIVLESELFEKEQVLNFDGFERKDVSFSISFSEDVLVGDYVVTVFLYQEGDLVGQNEEVFSILARDDVVREENLDEGFLHYDLDVVIKNEGNLEIEEEYAYSLGRFASMFLDSSIEVDSEKDGDFIWDVSLAPGESFNLNLSVDYRWFALVVFLVGVLAIFIFVYTRKDVGVKKKVVSLGRNKDGTAKLRIVISVKNKGFHRLSNVSVMDNVPGIAEIPKYFGTVEPSSITKSGNSTQLIWRIPTLGVNEERVFSYTTNSKRKLSESLVLPRVHARYLRGNRTIMVSSARIKFFGG